MALLGKWFDAVSWKKARVRKGPGGQVLLDIVKPAAKQSNPKRRRKTAKKAAPKKRAPAARRKTAKRKR